MAQPDLLGIVVRNMETSLDFYRLLGLNIPPEANDEQHVEFTTPGGFRIAWDTVELMQTLHEGWTEPAGHRMVLAFKCDHPSDVDALYEKVVAAGHQSHKPPWDAFWGQRYAIVKDPDGNLIDLFAEIA